MKAKRILLDQSAPLKLRKALNPLPVDSAREKGWAELGNGALIRKAEKNGYDVLVTCDQRMKYEQKTDTLKLGVVVIDETRWKYIKEKAFEIREAVNKVQPGEFEPVHIPRPSKESTMKLKHQKQGATQVDDIVSQRYDNPDHVVRDDGGDPTSGGNTEQERNEGHER